MRGLLKVLGRLFVMAMVMVVVVAASVLAGLAATASVGLAVVLAGIAGMVGVARRRPVPQPVPVMVEHPVVAAMAPEAVGEADPEAAMPRWRRPSLLAARHADPMRSVSAERQPMHFRPDLAPTTAELRLVRYAVVPLLDRPDEVLGLQIMDLIAGDEVQVIETSGAFWEVASPDGERGWVHRTTLGLPSTVGREPARDRAPSEADDVLTALLAARGIN